MKSFIEFLVSKRDDMLLFAVSLLISVLLFGQIQSGLEPGKEREFEVPLTFSNQSDEITVLQAPRSVKVVASGAQQDLDSLDTSKVRAIVDLKEAEPGVGRFRVEVVAPHRSGIEISPVRGIAELELESRLTKTFEVQLFTVGTPPENYTYNGVTVLPSDVEVSGPESNVPRVKSVRAILDLSRITPGQAVEVDLEALGEESRPVPLITINPPRVRILPAVTIGPSQRNLLVTAVFSGQPAVGYRVTGYDITPNQIGTTGESEDVSRVTTVNTEPINLNGLRVNRTFRAKLVLPPGLQATGATEVTVTVRVSRG